MRNPLLELSNEPGYEGLRELAMTLEKIADKINRFGGKVILPNLYLSTMDGYDMETILVALEETLIELRLFHFNHSMRHYCLSLDYAEENGTGLHSNFPAFKTLFDAMEEELSRFGAPYEGILAVDITDWVVKSATTEPKFLDFLRYMADVDERTLAIYIERSGSEEKAEIARRSLVAKTRLENVEVKLKSPQIALQILENELNSFGFCIREEAKEKMLETLDVVLKVKGQEGPWTIRQLAEDIVYRAYREGDDLHAELSLDDLAAFLPGGSWIADFAAKKRYFMGLIGEVE